MIADQNELVINFGAGRRHPLDGHLIKTRGIYYMPNFGHSRAAVGTRKKINHPELGV